MLKLSRKDEYGIEKNIAARSSKQALINSIPIPLIGSALEPDSSVLKKHPVLSVIGGQSATLGALDRNTAKKKDKYRYFPVAVATSIGGGIGSAVPLTLIGKYVTSRDKKTINKVTSNKLVRSSPLAKKIVKKYLAFNKGTTGQVLKKNLALTVPAALLLSPIKYAIGRTFGSKHRSKDYINK